VSPESDRARLPQVARSPLVHIHIFDRFRVVVRDYQLLLELMHKDFDARYAGSFLGILWTQLYPLLLLGVYSLVFSRIFRNDIPNFPLFLFVGIAMWSFFSNATQLATGSILANASLINKVGFPRELVTISVVLVASIDLLTSHVILLFGAVVFDVAPAWSWLGLPALTLLLVLVCVGLGLALATAAVYLRDVRFFTEVAVLLLMFLTPVFYSQDTVPPDLSWVVHVNPLATFITSYRQAFLNGIWPDPSSWAVMLVAALVAIWVGIEVFDRGQRGFPDAL
jgi:ABC-type polysaccharide/polyol phosphate export permease